MDTREEISCPACGEMILATARKCKHCGEWLETVEPPRVASEPLIRGSRDADAPERQARPTSWQCNNCNLTYLREVSSCVQCKSVVFVDNLGNSKAAAVASDANGEGVGFLNPRGETAVDNNQQRTIGSVLCFFGGIALLYGTFMSTTVTSEAQYLGGFTVPSMTVNNIGLMQDKQNLIMLGAIIGIGGAILVVLSNKK